MSCHYNPLIEAPHVPPKVNVCELVEGTRYALVALSLGFLYTDNCTKMEGLLGPPPYPQQASKQTGQAQR